MLIAGAHQEELAGRLLAGQLGDPLGFVEQLRLCAQPLAHIVLRLQLQQPGDAEQQEQAKQFAVADAGEQTGTQAQQVFAEAQQTGRGP
mgnify:CR=1 FL=1